MTTIEDQSFLAGGGEMGSIIRAFNWEDSPLGSPSGWPQPLKISIRLMLSTGHPMFIWWGPELIQFYNDAYRRSIGPERHPSAVGQRGRECWGEIWEIIGPQIDQVMAGQGHTWHENQLVPITRHGRREEAYWTYSYGPIDDPEAPNGVGGILVVCTETTQQVIAERRLKDAEARWRELFMQAPGFMCILRGPHHTFEFANPRCFELLGNRELIGKTVGEALPEFVSQGFDEILNEVYRTGSTHSGIETPVKLVDAEKGTSRLVYLDLVYQAIRNEQGEVTGIFLDGYDVTERVRSTARLQEEDRRKDEFIAILAHELRNPLSPIRNASELLKQMPADDNSIYEVGDLISRQVSQLTHLVDDLLDISRITQGRIELVRESVDLDIAIEMALEALQSLIQQYRHQVTYTKGVDRYFIQGDITRIVQCITNVLANAIKYTDQQGCISINLYRENQYAKITITDNGSGISPTMLPKIFDLFVQSDDALENSHGGLGIGLSVTQRLVRMHGGRVTAHSHGLGKGSTFDIILPLIDIAATNAKPIASASSTGKRILIIDDNKDAADSMAKLLGIKGHLTRATYSPKEGIQLAQTFDPDLVLLDIAMPEMDGYQVAIQLRSLAYQNKLVALTGYGQASDVERAMSAGFDEHFTKPVSLADLEKVLS